jgi:hypothetical protein
MRDLASNVKISRAISPVSVSDNTALVSQIISTKGFNSLMFAILIGAVADADATFAVLVEHGDSDTLADAAAVPDSMLNGLESEAAFQFDSDNGTREIGYVGDKDYVRLTITPSANAGAALIAAAAIQGHAASAPAA